MTPRRIDLQTESYDLTIRMGPPPTTPSMRVARPIALVPRYLYEAPAYVKQAPLRHPGDLSQHMLCVAQGATRRPGNATSGERYIVCVLPEWSLAPVQVHAITEARLLPARTRLFIDFLKTRLSSDA